MSWLVPSLLYTVMIGGLGVATKLALRHLSWQEAVLWTALVYVVIAVGMIGGGIAGVHVGPGTLMAILAGVLAAGGLIVFFIALRHGEASRVVPVTSAYPLVTLGLSAFVLAEHLSAVRVLGAALVVGGVVLLSIAS